MPAFEMVMLKELNFWGDWRGGTLFSFFFFCCCCIGVGSTHISLPLLVPINQLTEIQLLPTAKFKIAWTRVNWLLLSILSAKRRNRRFSKPQKCAFLIGTVHVTSSDQTLLLKEGI